MFAEVGQQFLDFLPIVPTVVVLGVLDRLLPALDRRLVISLLRVDVDEVPISRKCVCGCADLAEIVQCRLELIDSSIEIPALVGGNSEVVEARGRAVAVADLALDGEAVVVVLLGGVEIPALAGDQPVAALALDPSMSSTVINCGSRL